MGARAQVWTDLGSLIGVRRTQVGWTQGELARRSSGGGIEIRRAQIAHWENYGAPDVLVRYLLTCSALLMPTREVIQQIELDGRSRSGHAVPFQTARRRLGLSQAQAALRLESLGIPGSREYIARYESCPLPPVLDQFLRICRVLAIPFQLVRQLVATDHEARVAQLVEEIGPDPIRNLAQDGAVGSAVRLARARLAQADRDSERADNLVRLAIIARRSHRFLLSSRLAVQAARIAPADSESAILSRIQIAESNIERGRPWRAQRLLSQAPCDPRWPLANMKLRFHRARAAMYCGRFEHSTELRMQLISDTSISRLHTPLADVALDESVNAVLSGNYRRAAFWTDKAHDFAEQLQPTSASGNLISIARSELRQGQVEQVERTLARAEQLYSHERRADHRVMTADLRWRIATKRSDARGQRIAAAELHRALAQTPPDADAASSLQQSLCPLPQ